MTRMRPLLDAQGVERSLDELAAALRPDAGARGRESLALIGMRSRGDRLAERLAGRLGDPPVGVLDITLYRDDLGAQGPSPIVRTTDVSFPVDGIDVVLVDDVIMTGRSVRAALQSLIDLGRPRRVWLAVLVDRGGRELPIQPDHVGVSADLDPAERVAVQLTPDDPADGVWVRERNDGGAA